MLKVSASNLDRIAACPGSVAAESGMPYTPSLAAVEGSLLHDVLSGQRDMKGLTSGQRRYVNYCVEKGKELLAEYVDGEKPEFVREWYCQVRLLDGIVSAKCDFTAWGDTKALVIDWKFGHNPTERAEANRQLRPYAVIAAQEKPTIESVFVAIVQPTLSPDERVTVAEYTRDDIRAAKEEMNGLIREAVENPNKRVPGANCQYCKALGTSRCPESTEQAMALVPLTTRDVMPTGAELARFIESWKVLEPMGKMLMEHAREELQRDPDSVPGWTLKPDMPVRAIEDIEAAWAACDAAGVPPAVFMAACKVGVGTLEDALRAHFGWRAKDAKSELAKVLGDALTLEVRRGSVVRTK